MLPISVCMISKNEEQHIEECLKRLTPYHYEIIIADTGSTDNTIKTASKYTDKIYHFDWTDDFGAARNYALSKASNDWILSIDCDEYIEDIDEAGLETLIAAGTPNSRSHKEALGQILIRNRFKQNGRTTFENIRVSRFFNKNFYEYKGAIHEQLVYKNDPTGHINKTYPVPVRLLHVGYDKSEEEMRRKCLRNISMLEKELKATGPDAYIYFQLGQSNMRLNDYAKAFEWFDLGLSMDIDPSQPYVRTMVESYGYCLLELKKNKEALQLANIYDTFASRADFVFLMGLIYMNNGLFNEAVQEFRKSTTMEEFSVDGVNSYKAFYNIGVIYECTGHPAEAAVYYKKCGGYAPALARLKEIGR